MCNGPSGSILLVGWYSPSTHLVRITWISESCRSTLYPFGKRGASHLTSNALFDRSLPWIHKSAPNPTHSDTSDGADTKPINNDLTRSYLSMTWLPGHLLALIAFYSYWNQCILKSRRGRSDPWQPPDTFRRDIMAGTELCTPQSEPCASAPSVHTSVPHSQAIPNSLPSPLLLRPSVWAPHYSSLLLRQLGYARLHSLYRLDCRVPCVSCAEQPEHCCADLSANCSGFSMLLLSLLPPACQLLRANLRERATPGSFAHSCRTVVVVLGLSTRWCWRAY